MTLIQKLTIKASEQRQRLNVIAGLSGDELTDEIRAESDKLTGEYTDTETQLRAAVAAEGGPTETRTSTGPDDSEVRERLALRDRVSIGDYLTAAATGTEVRGAAAEYAGALGVGTFQRLPMELFHRFAPQTEERAITPGPAIDGMVSEAIQFVFERTAAASLGVQFMSHGPGQAQIPRVTTAPPTDTLAKGAAAPSTASAITLDSKAPERVSGQFEIRVEDLAVYPALETVLMEAIRRSLANETDEELISDLLATATDVSVAGATVTFETGTALFAGLVDGKHAYGYGDVRAIIGSDTFASFDGKYRSNGDMSLFASLASKLGSLRVSNRVPAKSGNGQKALVTLNASGDPIRTYVWDALEIIRDPYSGAGTGKVTLTATALLSSPHVPHGTAMLKELHPKIS